MIFSYTVFGKTLHWALVSNLNTSLMFPKPTVSSQSWISYFDCTNKHSLLVSVSFLCTVILLVSMMKGKVEELSNLGLKAFAIAAGDKVLRLC